MLAGLKRLCLRAWMSAQASAGASSGPEPQGVRRIAVWQFGGVGDMLLATPVIRALARAHPEAEIHLWCSDPPFAEFLERFPAVTKIHRFPVYDFDARTLLHRPVREALCALRDAMRDARPDLVVNLHIPALLDWWAVEWWLVRRLRAPYSLGFDPRFIRQGSVYSASLNASVRDGLHYTVLYQGLLARAGLACDPHTEFPLTDADREAATALLAAAGRVSGNPLVCLHIGGRRLQVEGRMWPVARFAALARGLLARGMVPVVIGVEADRPLARELCETAPGCIDLTGATGIAEMAALIAMADGFIGHDSGPFHVAVAVGTPAVAICGRPDAEPEYLNYGMANVAVLMADSPEAIAEEAVMARAMALFGHD